MAKRVKRPGAPITLMRGCMRSIHPDRARDDDLQFFLRISKESHKAIGRYIDKLLGRD